MAKNFALQTLLEIAGNQSEKAAASLGALRRHLQEHEDKLRLLLDYRDEYQQRLRRAGERGLDAAGLRNFYDFIERLEQAIGQQQTAVIDARERVQGGQTDWQLKERKFKAFDALAQRGNVAAQRRESYLEQKLQDDFASRASAGRTQTRR
jgi:flagellar FliJ protein